MSAKKVTSATMKATSNISPITPKVTNQRIERIPLDSIEIAHYTQKSGGYQRDTSPTQVAKIIAQFDESKLGALTVSSRGGKYYLVDGALS